MAATEPIRSKKQLKEIADYFLERGQLRNYTMVITDVYTVLRISDLLRLKWSDVYDERSNTFRTHIEIVEKKTGKSRSIALNKKVIGALRLYLPHRRGEFIFANNRRENPQPISRIQAWRVLRSAITELGIVGKIAPHSLRKTFGYFAWNGGDIPIPVIMKIYNHSNFAVTMRYLGIEQDDIDNALLNIELI